MNVPQVSESHLCLSRKKLTNDALCALHILQCRALVFGGKAQRPAVFDGQIHSSTDAHCYWLVPFCRSFALFNETHLGAPVFVFSRLVAQSTFLITYASYRPVLRLGKLRAPGCDRPSLFPQDSGWKSPPFLPLPTAHNGHILYRHAHKLAYPSYTWEIIPVPSTRGNNWAQGMMLLCPSLSTEDEEGPGQRSHLVQIHGLKDGTELKARLLSDTGVMGHKSTGKREE
ncbi:hypothetical protein ACRRTK_001479 [Alexandromys fortis]